MDPIREQIELMTRRHFFGRTGLGLGTAALSTLLAENARSETSPTGGSTASATLTGGLPGLPHFPPKAKRAIYLHMNGGPSQMDLFDYKPKMDAMFDKDLPDSIRKGQRLTTMTSGQARFPVAPSKYKFAQHGQSGMWVSELLPWTAKLVDEIALVKTVWTEAINHDPAVTYICTGNQLPGRPSLGSWLSYGLGTMNQNLPAFVVMTASWSSKAAAQALYNRLWGAGYPAQQAPGRRPPLQRRPGPLPVQPPGRRRRHPPPHARRPQPAEPQRVRASSPTPRPRPGSPSTRWRSACRRRSPS